MPLCDSIVIRSLVPAVLCNLLLSLLPGVLLFALLCGVIAILRATGLENGSASP